MVPATLAASLVGGLVLLTGGTVDLVAVLGIALLGAVLLATGGRLSRGEDVGLLTVYGAYLAVNAGAAG